jgi:hypothetical protein
MTLATINNNHTPNNGVTQSCRLQTTPCDDTTIQQIKLMWNASKVVVGGCEIDKNRVRVLCRRQGFRQVQVLVVGERLWALVVPTYIVGVTFVVNHPQEFKSTGLHNKNQIF